MRPMLFGEHLSRLVRLSTHDVSEILEDQTASRRRFGEIALSWDLCRPQHVWEAWCNQLTSQSQHVDLATVGVDAQALAHVPKKVAQQFNVLPLRAHGNQVVLAVAQEDLERASVTLPKLLNKTLRFVIAESQQVKAFIRAYYTKVRMHAETD